MTWRFLSTPGVIALLVACSHAAGAEPPDSLDRRPLAGPDTAARWSTAESTMEASKARVRDGTAESLHWHITVDHFAGEPRYPIGWPRVSLAFKDAAQGDWSAWDYLEMWVYTQTSRPALPREPVALALHAPDKANAWHRDLAELAKDQWVRIRIPLADLPRRDDVRLVQLNISESRYRHGDTLDFYVDGLTLLRHARPTVLEFAARESVVFTDARAVGATFTLAGVKPAEPVDVALELRRGGKVIAAERRKAGRGPQSQSLGLAGAKLEAGEYELCARVGDAADVVRAPLRVVASPWKGD